MLCFCSGADEDASSNDPNIPGAAQIESSQDDKTWLSEREVLQAIYGDDISFPSEISMRIALGMRRYVKACNDGGK